jgi:hypothetical protein
MAWILGRTAACFILALAFVGLLPAAAAGQIVPSSNSTSQGRSAGLYTPVPEQPFGGDGRHRIVVANDLGMHCADLDTRIASILPPYNVLHAQVISIAAKPKLLADRLVGVVYSAASNASDPASSTSPVVAADGSVFKSNFWDVVAKAYGPFYPPGALAPFFPTTPQRTDIGLPVPDLEQFYLGSGKLVLNQQTMPSVTKLTLDPTTHVPITLRTKPYVANVPQPFKVFEQSWPLFENFRFGYVANNTNWFAAEGIPMATFDDIGRWNPFPLLRVQAVDKGTGKTLASLDAVIPVSGETNCKTCHLPFPDGNGLATGKIARPKGPAHDPSFGHVPAWVSEEWAADVNMVRLHDKLHGTKLFTGFDPKTGVASTPVACQSCHYTPALDLLQKGPQSAGGLGQGSNQSMSRVMHNGHGSLTIGGRDLFPMMPPPDDPRRKNSGPNPINAFTQKTLEASCYQCHPGKLTQCLRGVMYNVAGAVCQDCHGQMTQVGDDFSRNQPGGRFVIRSDFYGNPRTPRVPWLNEPTCGSCHTGDATSNLTRMPGTIPASDKIRLLQAYLAGSPKATPILPSNMRFAEPRVASGPARGNPQLFRLSVDAHGGVFCEGCHGSTHAEWPVRDANANDNVAAMELQGHAGKIVECATCHKGLLGLTLAGPHGMHPVGNNGYSANWAANHSDYVDGHGLNGCKACHGVHGEGTVLATVAIDRPNLPCAEGGGPLCRAGRVTLTAATKVGCNICHANPIH